MQTKMTAVRLVVVLLSVAGALATMTCEEVKPELKYAWLFGPQAVLYLSPGMTEVRSLKVTPEMLEWGSKDVTFYLDFETETGDNQDYYLFDEGQYMIFTAGQAATPLMKQENSSGCSFWQSVTDENTYYCVVRSHNSAGYCNVKGSIWATYWAVK